MNQDENFNVTTVMKLEQRINELLGYIEFLGELYDVCTFERTRKICGSCKCKRSKNINNSTPRK